MTRPTMLLRLIAVAVLAVGLTGCGGGDDSSSSSGSTGNAKAGKALFVSKCGSCHTLSDAGTSGHVGPELDGTNFTVDRVKSQIERGGGSMPPKLVEGAEADDVAAYVAKASGT